MHCLRMHDVVITFLYSINGNIYNGPQIKGNLYRYQDSSYKNCLPMALLPHFRNL